MELDLSAVEARVVGVLMEKEKATPQNYPLTLKIMLETAPFISNFLLQVFGELATPILMTFQLLAQART